MPTSEVYLCDKQEDLPNDPGRSCRKAVGDDGVDLVLTLSTSGSGPTSRDARMPPSRTEWGVVFERKFCGRTHANYWLIRQRLARDAGD